MGWLLVNLLTSIIGVSDAVAAAEQSGITIGSPLVVPPAITCGGSRKAHYEWNITQCVELNKSNPTVPTFDECPQGMALEGYYCVGYSETDTVFNCPPKYWPSGEGSTCIQATIYDAFQEQGYCPAGYDLELNMAAEIFSDLEKSTCVKSMAVAPSVVTSNKSVMTAIPPDFGGIYTNPTLDSKDGHRQLLDNPQRPSRNWRLLLSCPPGTDAVHLSEESGDVVCVSHESVPVQHILYSCNEGDVLSQNFGGNRCLSIQVADSEVGCPEGYALSGGVCASTKLQAANPQCPTNARLVGRLQSSPVCEEYSQTDAELNCHNLNSGVGVEYTAVDAALHSALPLCSYAFDESKYTVSDEVPLTRRQKMDARIAERKGGSGHGGGGSAHGGEGDAHGGGHR